MPLLGVCVPRIVDGLTFDDVLLVLLFKKSCQNLPNLTTRLTKNITLNLPLVSAVWMMTESEMAIMAQLGGIGILHKSMDIDKQATQVRRKKESRYGRRSYY